jgi:hypothetical protein
MRQAYKSGFIGPEGRFGWRCDSGMIVASGLAVFSRPNRDSKHRGKSAEKLQKNSR